MDRTGKVSLAMHSAAWLLWREFLMGNHLSMYRTLDARQAYLKQLTSDMLDWMMPPSAEEEEEEQPPLEYAACYEQACEFWHAVGADRVSLDDMRKIVQQLETKGTSSEYEAVIVGLLHRYELEDTTVNRHHMQRVYAANECFQHFCVCLMRPDAESMASGRAFSPKVQVEALGMLRDICRRISSDPEEDDTGDEGAVATPEHQQPQQQSQGGEDEHSVRYRRMRERRATSRRNLNEVESQYIALVTEAAKKRKQRGGALKRFRFNSITGRRKGGFNTKRSFAPDGTLLHSKHGVNLYQEESSSSSTQPHSENVRALVSPRRVTEGSIQQSSTVPESEEDSSSSTSSSSSPMSSLTRLKYIANDFIKQTWAYLQVNGFSAGMSEFLSAYKPAEPTFLQSVERRVVFLETVIDPMDVTSRNLLTHIASTVCRKETDLFQELERQRSIFSHHTTGWTKHVDDLCMMSAILIRMAVALTEKLKYLVQELSKSDVCLLASNTQLRDLNLAFTTIIAKRDDVITELQVELNRKIIITK